MSRWSLNACVFLILVTLISTAFAPTTLPAGELSGHDRQTLLEAGPVDRDRQAIGPEIAGAGLAGAGVGQTINPVVLRNVLIGLACAGLWLFSAMNQGD